MENPSLRTNQQLSALERGSGRVTKRMSQKGSAGDPPRPQAQKVAVACEECREKKRKCSGTRPQCDGCAKKRLRCVYGRYSLKRGWPENIIEILHGRIVELETAQNSDMRHPGLSSSRLPGSSESHLQNGDRSPSTTHLHSPFHPTVLSLDVTSQPELASSVPQQEGHGLGSYAIKDAQARESLNEGSSTTDLAPAIRSSCYVHDEISVPTPTPTLEADKDESGVDAMGATSSVANEKGSNSSFFGTSSTISFMRKIQDAMRSCNAKSTFDSNQDIDNSEQYVSSNRSDLHLGLIGPPWRTGGLNSEHESIDYLIPPRSEADALVKNYFENVFILRPYIHRAAFEKNYMKLWTTEGPDLNKERASSVSNDRPNRDEIERIQFYLTVNLVFALGCRLSPSSNPSERILRSERFFQRTQQPRIFQIMHYSSLELVQSLLLMGQYLQSTERSTQCWNVIGFAIRVAQGIGLHLDPPATMNRSQLEVEMRRRVWWGCIAVDRELSMTYGRPVMVHPTMNCGIRLPSIIDDHLLSNNPAREATLSNEQGVSMAFFVYTLKLSNILCEILVMLQFQDYNQQKTSYAPVEEDATEQYLARPDTQTLLSLDNLLNRWLESLPPYLRTTGHGNEPREIDSSQSFDFDIDMKAALKRQANILHTQYLHLRVLLFRPLLLELFNKSNAPLRYSEKSGAMNTVLQQTMSASISKICVSIAQQQIEHIYKNVTASGTEIYAWWYIVYYVYTCAIVIMTGRLCPSILDPSDEKGLADSWERALKCLESYRIFSQPAQKGFKILAILDRQLFGSQTKYLFERPLNNTSLPVPVEEDQTGNQLNSNIRDDLVTNTSLHVQPHARPNPFESAEDSNGDRNQSTIIHAEEFGAYSGMEFTCDQDELQLDWLSSVPFVNQSFDDIFGISNSNIL